MTRPSLTVAQLIETLRRLPQDRPVMVRVREHAQGGGFDLFVPVTGAETANDPWPAQDRDPECVEIRVAGG